MKKLFICLLISAQLIVFGGLAFAYTGNVQDFTIDSVQIAANGDIYIWGKTPSQSSNISFKILSSNTLKNEMLAVALTAQSLGGTVGGYIVNNYFQSLYVKN